MHRLALTGSDIESHVGPNPSFFSSSAFEINSSNFLIKGKSKAIVIKIIDSRDLDHVDARSLISNYLTDEGCCVPKLLSTNTDREKNKTPYITLDYIGGSYFRGSYADLEKSGPAIAKIHSSLSKLENSKILDIPKIEWKTNQFFPRQVKKESLLKQSWEAIWRHAGRFTSLTQKYSC